MPNITPEEVQKLTKAQLIPLCRSLELEVGGTKEELKTRILEALSTPDAPTGTAVIKDNFNELWEENIRRRVTGLPPFKEIWFSWQNDQILVTPALWPVMFYTKPFHDSDFFGLLGTDGDISKAVMIKWERILSISPSESRHLKDTFVTLHEVLTTSKIFSKFEEPTSVEISLWCERHWNTLITPLIQHVIRLQASKLRSQGYHHLANRADLEAEACLSATGYDLRPALEKTLKNDIRNESTPSTRRNKGQQGSHQPPTKAKCRNCHELATPKEGESLRDYFTKHNQVCSKAKK